MNKGTLYLIPSWLGDVEDLDVLSKKALDKARTLDFFLAENPKHTRAFLKKIGHEKPLQELQVLPLNEHTRAEEFPELFAPLTQGKEVGIISEAGCPVIADPGSEIIRMAQRKGIKVVPFSGPSSILLALMGSGFAGQQFVFHGYLPKDANPRRNSIKKMEKEASHYAQLFMETPYRNESLLKELLESLQPDTLLCVACDLTQPGESILTRSIKEWKSQTRPNYHKRPCIFVIGR